MGRDLGASPFAALGQERRFRKGTTIMLQGDVVSTVHLIVEGWAKVVRTMPSGRELLILLLGPGEAVGHFEAIEGGDARHWASVIALEDARTSAVPAGSYLAHLREHPDGALAELRLLLERLRRVDQSRLEAVLFDTAHRLAALLVDMADRYATTTPQGVVLGVALSQDEMSTMIGASRDSVARALASLRARQMVRTGRRTITIVDLDALRAFANEML